MMNQHLIPGRKSMALALLLAGSALPVCAQYLEHIYEYIEKTSVYEQNQEEGHAYYLADQHLSLNGDWRFLYADTPEEIPLDFYQPAFRDSKWSHIQVPSNWEMEGWGDPQFRNVPAPFKANPPYVPREYNPTGAYRRTFLLPASWQGQQVFLRLEKTQSASFVWMNGQEVGYNEGGQEPAEYDVTPYVKPGRNTLAVCVMKYSDGYYLEGQDYWRLAGIFDDVTLYATPRTRIFDWYVTTDLDDQYRDAELRVKVDVKGYGDAPAVRAVRAILSDARGREVTRMASEAFAIRQGDKATLELKAHVVNPAKWTCETPHLYALRLELLDEGGSVMQQITSRMGFKETEIRHQTFYLNGQPIKVNAINSHMQHPEKGHAMDEATIRRDMEILKQHNFNAVRTSHYPPVNKYLELADEYGLYIIDEAGDEAHATEYISNDPRYIPMYQERVRQLVLRDRNHPCVLFWSAGNESGEGPNITEVVNEGKRLDPSRYFMYGGNAYAHPGEEIIGPRYPTPYELEMNTALVTEEEDPRPSFMDEYLSVAGNAGGGMDEFWDAVRRHPRLMGGAIWDLVSPGLTGRIRPLTDSSPYHTPVHLMGNAKVTKGVLRLSGHDEWVEVYRSQNVELTGSALTIAFDVKPGKLSGMHEGAPYVTKGNTQFGVVQHGADKLRFYLHSGVKHSLEVALPEDWIGQWHHVTASWDGSEMRLYVDGRLLGSETIERQPSSGNPWGQRPKERGCLSNFPYPVNIGRYAGNQAADPQTIYTADAEMDNVAIYDKCLADGQGRAEDAVLYLTFDDNGDEGTFYTIGGNMRTYGCVWPDRRVQPEMLQMKWTTQPISIRLLDAATGEAEVTNRQYFADLSAYATHWALMADGDVVEEGDLQLAAGPQQRTVFTIPYHKPQIEPGREYRIHVSSVLRNDECWAKAGHEVAWDQLELTDWHVAAPDLRRTGRAVNVGEDEKQIVVTGEGFGYVVSKESGNLEQIVVDGRELLKAPLSFNLWRAPLANEFDAWASYRMGGSAFAEGYGGMVSTLFYTKGLNQLRIRPAEVSLTHNERETTVRVHQLVQVGATSYGSLDLYIEGVQMAGYTIDYTYNFHDDGTVCIQTHLSPQGKLPDLLPRIGFTTSVNGDFDQVTWYGRGPEENYPDRKTGYPIGVWSRDVDEMYEPYLFPQDHALRCDVRYLQLLDSAGKGVRIAMDELFNFNAYRFTTENLTKSQFTYQLQPQPDRYTLNLDYSTTGVGCTCVYVLDEYRVRPMAYDREIVISPCGL